MAVRTNSSAGERGIFAVRTSNVATEKIAPTDSASWVSVMLAGTWRS